MTLADGQDRATGRQPDQAAAKGARSLLGPAIKTAALIFALVLGAIAVTAWLAGEPEELPFDYEGFD